MTLILTIQQVENLTSIFSTKDGQTYHSDKRQKLVEKKTDFVLLLGIVSPVIDHLLRSFSSCNLSANASVALGIATIAKRVFNPILQHDNFSNTHCKIRGLLLFVEHKVACEIYGKVALLLIRQRLVL